MGDFRELLACLLHHRQHLQRRQQAIACGREIRQHDVARLFAANVEALLQHARHDIAVADLRALHLHADALEMVLEAEIGHDGRNDRVLRQPALALPGRGDETEQLVAIDDLAMLVAHHHAVGVAIERDADVSTIAMHGVDHGARIGGADLAVDVEAAGFVADCEDFRSKLIERLGGDLVGRAVGAIDDNAQAGKAELAGKGRFDDLDIARLRIVHALRPAQIRRRGKVLLERPRHQRLDRELGFIRQLVAIRPEQLDAVVLIGIVRGRNHHAEICAERARQHRHAGRRQRPEQHHVHTLGGKAGRQRRLQHVAGQPRVLADDHKMPARVGLAEVGSGSHAQPHRDLRRHRPGIGLTANTIRAEEFPRCHRSSLKRTCKSRSGRLRLMALAETP